MNQATRSVAVASVLAVAAMHASPALAQSMTLEQARKQVAPFYEMLNQPAGKDLKALSEQALSPDWKSYSNETDFNPNFPLAPMSNGSH